MVVLDSSFLVAYHNTRDVHHGAAARAMVHLLAGKWGRALLLEYVFLEVITVLLVRRGLAVASEAATRLLEAREVEFLPCSDLFLEALHIFQNQASERLSFTDAAILTVARREAPGFVATFDRDFRDLEGVSVVPD